MKKQKINKIVVKSTILIKELSRKLAYYLAIFAMVFGSTFGAMNSANAAALTLTENSTNASSGINANGTAATLDVTGADSVNVVDFDLVITNVEDSATALIIGAITGTADDSDTNPELRIIFDEDDAAVAQLVTIASVAFTADNDTAGLINIDGGDSAGTSGAITFTGDVDTGLFGSTRGIMDIDMAASSATTPVLTVNFGGNVSATTTLNQDAELIVLNVNGTADQTWTGLLDSNGGAGEGTLNITKASGTATFANNIGASEALLLIDATSATSTAVFNGAVSAVTVDSAGSMTFNGVVTATALNIQTAADATFAGRIIETASSTSKLDLIGATTVTVGFGHTTAGSSNTMDDVDMHATSTLILSDTITNGMHVFGTATVDAADVANGSKIYMPINLSDAQTIIIFKTDNGADVDEATDLALQDNALITYDAAGTATTIVTATATTDAARATSLGITTDQAKAVSQAYLSAINDTNADATAEDAFGNAFNALGGMTATTDTDLALQVAPQSDVISGSTSATRAMTGTVQGIVSNRMASLRSGDAYVTGVSAGDSMSAKSGFIQVFGSNAQQNNIKNGSGTVYGYDTETGGVAFGFDGMTESGSTVGLSASFSTTDVDGKGTGKSKNKIDSYTVSVYADQATENSYIEGSITYGINDNTTDRLVNVAGLNRSYTAAYDSSQISLNVTGGTPYDMGNDTFITPYGSFTSSFISTDSYIEKSTTASDNLRLKVAQDDYTSMIGSIGIKAHKITDSGTPMVSFAINNEFGDSKINSTNTYQGGGTAFKTSTDVEALSATLGLGFSFGDEMLSLNIGYEGEMDDNEYTSHYGSLKVISKF